jgi:hypothetical protein
MDGYLVTLTWIGSGSGGTKISTVAFQLSLGHKYLFKKIFYSNFFVIITEGKQLDEQRSHLVQQVDGTWWAGLPPQVVVIHVNSNPSWL